MSFEQQVSLMIMFVVGGISFGLFADEWELWTPSRRVLAVTWLIFWLGPPLYFIWTKGVLG